MPPKTLRLLKLVLGGIYQANYLYLLTHMPFLGLFLSVPIEAFVNILIAQSIVSNYLTLGQYFVG